MNIPSKKLNKTMFYKVGSKLSRDKIVETSLKSRFARAIVTFIIELFTKSLFRFDWFQ